MDMLPDLHATRILVVESDLNAADRAVNILRDSGFAVQNAYNPGDALAADHSHFDLALVNPAMRDREGVSIMERIRQHETFTKLPLLVMGNGSEIPVNGLALRSGYQDTELIDSVRALLRQKTNSGSRRVSQPTYTRLTEDDIPTEPMRASFDAHLQQQLAELKVLSNLGRSISSVLELSEVLNQIVEAATTLTRAEEGLLLLPDDEGKALFLRAMKGVDDQSARNFRVKTDDPLVGRVFVSGEPVLVNDKGLKRVKTEYFVKSLLYVPMTYKNQTMGVLGVNNRAVERTFSTHDQELLLDLAAYAAVAISNAQLFEERLVQNRRLTMLVAAGNAVNSTLALGDVLTILCRQIILTLGVNACTISQQNMVTGDLYPLATARRIVGRPEQGPSMALDKRPVLKQALEQNAFYTVQRGKLGTHWLSEQRYLERDNASQMLVLPIRPGNMPAVGVLELSYYEAIPEVSSEFRAGLRSAALEILASVTDRSNAAPINFIFGHAQKILDLSTASWMTLSLVQNGTTLLKVLEYGATIFSSEVPAQHPLYPRNFAKFEGHTLLNYNQRDPNLPDEVQSALAEYSAIGLLSMPVMIKDSAFGAVTVYDTYELRRFREGEINLLSALVTRAATAIENARLYNDREQSLADLQDAQASLVQAARLSTMGELAAVVAHQINNPLTTIIVDSELILQEKNLSGPIHEGVTAIHRAGQRAHTVVKRLLSTARRDITQESLQPTDAHATIHNTLELITTHIERSKVRLQIKLDEAEPVYVQAAPGQLEDVWLNLLLNARDALLNRPEATIVVQSEHMDHSLEVSVCDNGPGISNEALKHIFDAFFTTKPHGEGTGLGLYICKQIVDRCGGTIQVESVLNEGTCFRVSLPIIRRLA
jgi:signal transduction histidine kinase/DNA-binding response OmpR family regulator